MVLFQHYGAALTRLRRRVQPLPKRAKDANTASRKDYHTRTPSKSQSEPKLRYPLDAEDATSTLLLIVLSNGGK